MRAALIAAALSLGLAAAASAEPIDREFHESFEVARGARLELVHGDGGVEITPWERDVIDVHVVYRAELKSIGAATKPDFQVDFSQRGGTVRVVGRETGRRGFGWFTSRNREHRYTVRAPAWVVLELDGDDGDVELTGWRAAVDIELDDGDVEIADVRGDVRLELEDGDVVIAGLEGELAAELDDGDVRITDCRSPRLRIRAQDGNLAVDRCDGSMEITVDDGDVELTRISGSRFRIRGEDGDVELELVSARDLDLEIELDDGDVDLRLSPEISASFTVETDDGAVRVSPEERVTSRSRHRVSGRLGDGAGTIRIRTHDGDVTLR